MNTDGVRAPRTGLPTRRAEGAAAVDGHKLLLPRCAVGSGRAEFGDQMVRISGQGGEEIPSLLPGTERMTAKSFAPSSDRNPPEIFCRSFIILPSRSARLLVNGTRGSVRKRSTSWR